MLASKPLLKDLLNIVTPDYAVHWRKIGENLGIKSGVLDTIDHDNHHKAEDCCNTVWEEWLDIDTTAAWCKVIEIINSSTIVNAITSMAMSTDDPIWCTVLNASDQMRQFYNNERYAYKCKEDDWPPYQPDHFTSVALIHHKEKHATRKEVIAVATSWAYKGNVEYLINNNYSPNATSSTNHESSNEYFMDCHSTKDIAEIFKYASPQTPNASNNFMVVPNFVLIEGAPGIGKTILSKEIAFQWANKNLLSDTSLLFLIFLRDPYVKNISSLKEFVRYAICSSEQTERIDMIVQFLDNTLGSYITIVFDGYDEISDKVRYNSFIAKIINREILALCRLVVTSRPTVSTALHGTCDCRVEILGFTKQDRMEYIKQSLEGNLEQITQISDYLDKNPFINSLCYIPLNMTILICLFKEFLEDRCMLPNNQTEMNEQFICVTISRFLRKKNLSLTIKSLEMLQEPYKKQFKNLSELAFHMLGKNIIVFNDDDIRNYLNWSDLGLLKAVKHSRYITRTSNTTSYNFLHFSLQEFMSAYYVTSLSIVKQIKLIRYHFWESRYLNSWIMYVGLSKGMTFALKLFLIGPVKAILDSVPIFESNTRGIANKITSDKVKRLHLFQCFLEAGDDKMCQVVGSYLVDKNIDLSNVTLLLKDIHILCFFLTRSTTKQWKLLDLSNCCIGDTGCDTLVNLLLSDDQMKVQIPKINLSGNQLTSISIFTIFKLIHYFNSNELIVTSNIFDSELFLDVCFEKVIQQQLFQEKNKLVSIKANDSSILLYAINCEDFHVSKKLPPDYLYNTSNTYSLCLWNTDFKLGDILKLASHIHCSIELNIYNDKSCDQILNILLEIQKAINIIKEESTDFKQIVLQVSYILVSQTQLFAYNVNHNQIIQVMKYRCKPELLTLNFNSCSLLSESLDTIGKNLSVGFRQLKVIEISGCKVEDVQCQGFYKALNSNSCSIKHLKEINLSSNNLTNDCILTIVEFLQYCVVEKLNISYNNLKENVFHNTLKCFYNKPTLLLNSTLNIPLVVINDVSNLQHDNCKSLQHDTYVDVYIMNCADTADVFDFLFTSVNDHILHHVVFFDCASLLICNLDKISLLLKNMIKLEIQISQLSEVVAARFLKRFRNISLNYKSFQYFLNTETGLFVHNQKYDEIKTLLPGDNSKVTFQYKDCDVPHDTAIYQILTNINFLKRIRLLDLSGCGIDDNGCETFCTTFGRYITKNSAAYLHELNLSNNCLTSKCAVYIVKLLQFCTVKILILLHNDINTEEFHKVYFNNRYHTYNNFNSKVPLLVINSKNSNAQHMEKLHFVLYFLSMPQIEDLTSILSMAANYKYHGWIFIININITVDYFNTIMQQLLANKMIKITIIENHLEDDVAINIIYQLKELQVIRYRETRDRKSVQYLLLSKNNFLANNIDQIADTEVLKFCELKELKDHDILSSLSFLIDSHKQLKSIDISNCYIGDNGCTTLLSYFTLPEYASPINLLNLSNNLLSSYSTDNIAKLVVYSKLQTLFVSHNDVKENNIADAVCKLQSKSTDCSCLPVIQIFRSHCAALIINNLIISSIHKVINCKTYSVTYLSMMNCYINDEEHTSAATAYELNFSQRILREFDIECDIDDLEANKRITHFIIKYSYITHKAIMLLTTKTLQHNLFTQIEISHCKLQETGLFSVIDTIKEASSLKVLDLSYNIISDIVANKIAGFISKNLQLEVLNLSKCNFQKNGMRSILKALNTSSLKHINFSSIKYGYYCGNDNSKNSKDQPTLTFSINLLPSIINNNQSLEHVNISNCKLTADDFADIMKNISQLKLVRHLDISSNTMTDKVADYVALAIRNNRNLEYLNVSNCYIGEDGLFTVFNALSDLSSLVHIDISFTKIFNTAAEEIVNVFSLNKKLAYVKLHQCEIDSNSFNQIMSSMKKNVFLLHLDVSRTQMTKNISFFINHPLLQYLDISFCKLTEESIKLFSRFLERLSNLKYFNISHNNVSHSSAENIALAIVKNASLEHLDLSECGFVNFLVIDASLQRNSKVKKLILRSNVIYRNKQSKQLQVVGNNSSVLEHLDLSHCNISELRMKIIVRKLCQVSTLKCIDISYIILPNDAAINIALVICRNLFLEKLNLSGCELSESQIMNTVKALNNLSRLKYLNISHNKVNDDAANKLASALTTNPLLEHLKLSNCELSELQITGIVKALSEKESFLMFLDISHNTITNNESDEISSVVINSPLLEHLNLAHCKLSELQLISILKALGKTSLLKFLDVSHNEVSREAANEISSVIVNNRSLQYLNLSACNLEEDSLITISDSLACITHLVSIDVSYNCITEKAAYKVAIALRKNTSLERLSFCACFEDNAALTIFNAISQHSGITHLNINLNVINSGLADLIVSVLMNNTNIDHVDFGQCDLQESEFVKLLNGLANITTLQYLNLEGNKISKHLVPKITSLICKNNTLKYINMCNCNLPKVEVQNILHAISELNSVECLKISGNQMSNSDCECLKEALSNNSRIRCLDCSRCTIKGEGLLTILDLIYANSMSCIESLNLQSCCFNEISASILLPSIIINNKSLKYLNLTNCNLKEEGLITIAKALQASTAIRYLILSSNHISNAVSQEIASAVSKNCKLQCLAFSDCGLKDPGLMVIAQALCKISSLKHLDLSHNNITDENAIVIASAIANNNAMQYLDFSFCTWQQTGITILCEAVIKLPIIKEAYILLHTYL